MATTYTVGDQASSDSGLTYDEALDRIAEWYADSAEWATGHATDEENAVIRDAIDSVERPGDDGDIGDLIEYAENICEAVAVASGAKSFAGHGNYYVSAAARAGLSLTVSEEE